MPAVIVMLGRDRDPDPQLDFAPQEERAQRGRPRRCVAGASASSVAAIAAPGWMTVAKCVSSKSSTCAAKPLASAAKCASARALHGRRSARAESRRRRARRAGSRRRRRVGGTDSHRQHVEQRPLGLVHDRGREIVETKRPDRRSQRLRDGCPVGRGGHAAGLNHRAAGPSPGGSMCLVDEARTAEGPAG